MNASAAGSPGFGLGLRTAHYHDFLTAPQRVDWLEIITDNFLVDGGKPLAVLDAIRRDYPIAMHGVAMSVGSAAGLDFAYLSKVKQLARRIVPLWVSDHLCWTGFGGDVLHDLYPMPYTEETARLLITQIRQAQDILERRLVLENVSSYVRFSASTETEWAFLAHVLEQADCELLLDVNNVYVSSINHGFSAEDYLNGLPPGRVRQMHLAGHSRSGGHIIDTHDHPVAPEVWALYASACRRFPHVATMIERDDEIPPLPILIAELDHAREIAASAIVQTSAGTAHTLRPAPPCAPGALHRTQGRLAAFILDADPAALPDDIDTAGALAGARGMDIYRHAYRERLTGVLVDSYPKCQLYLGTELFSEIARQYIAGHAPRERHLGGYGAQFSALLQARYPGNPELHDLAQLEWALRDVFDAGDVPAWTASTVAQEGAAACLSSWPILHPTLRLLTVQSNAVAIWRAIDADGDVPEVAYRDEPQTLAVWRKGHQPHFKSLDSSEAAFLRALAHDGATIALVAQGWEEAGELTDPAILGAWLSEWWTDELLLWQAPAAAFQSSAKNRRLAA